MNWPWTRRSVTVVLKHEIVGLDGLTEAIHALADAKKYEAKVRAGFVRPKTKEEMTVPPEWRAWEESHPHIDENERSHLYWVWRVLLGTESVTEEKREEAIMLYSKAQGAGYGLPTVDGRMAAGSAR